MQKAKRKHRGYTVLEAVICIAISAVLFALIFVYLHGLTSLTTGSAIDYTTETNKSSLTQTIVGDMQSAALAAVTDENNLVLSSDRWVIRYTIEGEGIDKTLVRTIQDLNGSTPETREMLKMEAGSFQIKDGTTVAIFMHIKEGNDYSLSLRLKGA